MANSNSNSTGYGGISTTGLLGVLFIGLKLTGHINWPWVWVLSPFWIPVAVACFLLVAALVFWCIGKIIEKA